MERITIFRRTTKEKGSIRLRFRLRDGASVDLYHKSDIKADLVALDQFTDEGNKKPRVMNYDKKLHSDIRKEIEAMQQAYNSMKEDSTAITSDEFNRRVDAILNPKEHEQAKENIVDRFKRFTDDMVEDGVIGFNRVTHYDVLRRIMERYLTISHTPMLAASEFDVKQLRSFRDFLKNEYQYVSQWPDLYEDVRKNNIPQEKRSQNTCAAKLKILKLFFDELVRMDEIAKSPFDTINKNAKSVMLSSKYDTPVCLYKEELEKVMTIEAPAYLQEAKDAFIVQCALGCRISDFKSMGMKNVAVDGGIPYVHYLPKKTQGKQSDNSEVKTPVVKYAFDIIIKYGFSFPVLRNTGGHLGYNEKIRRILELAGIDRPCEVYDEEKGTNVYVPLHELGSSKLGRKTYVDRLSKVQIDIYKSGLHKQGSTAAKRYVDMSMKEKFEMANLAFDQPFYKVDDDLNIVSVGEDKPQDLADMVANMSDEDKTNLLKLLLKQ